MGGQNVFPYSMVLTKSCATFPQIQYLAMCERILSDGYKREQRGFGVTRDNAVIEARYRSFADGGWLCVVGTNIKLAPETLSHAAKRQEEAGRRR